MRIVTDKNREDVYMSTPINLQFPALDGFTVTEAHTNICKDRGHTLHLIDNKFCQRCGEPATIFDTFFGEGV